MGGGRVKTRRKLAVRGLALSSDKKPGHRARDPRYLPSWEAQQRQIEASWVPDLDLRPCREG